MTDLEFVTGMKNKMQRALESQKRSCVEAIGHGTSNVTNGYRAKVEGAKMVDVPTFTLPTKMPCPEPEEPKVPVTLLIISGAIGLVTGVTATFFFKDLFNSL